MSTKFSKTTLIRTAVAAGSIALAAAAAPAAFAATSHDDGGKSSAQVAGTWLTTVHLINPPPGVGADFQALDTFTPGHQLLVSSAQAKPGTRTLGQGGWTYLGQRRYAASFTWFRFDATGTYVGMQRVRQTVELAQDGASYTTRDAVEILSPEGTVIVTIRATEIGQRVPTHGA